MFLGILGAIDGCHIRIVKPRDYPNSYVNRKGYPSVLLQGICDSRKLFLDVYAGEPGSIHDARLFQKSDFYQRLRNREIVFPNDTHLVGDLAYPLSKNLLVGFKDNGQLTARQRLFNRKLSETRVVIENAFGLLKCRFRRLKFMETVKLDLLVLLIMSACILHNFCIINNDMVDMDYEEANDIPVVVEEVNINAGRAAIDKRNNIAEMLYAQEN